MIQVAKVEMFSGLNNLWVDNVFSKRFGFTENDVKEILLYYDHLEKFNKVREWYNGYRFEDAEVYNLFNVMSYVAKRFTPANY